MHIVGPVGPDAGVGPGAGSSSAFMVATQQQQVRLLLCGLAGAALRLVLLVGGAHGRLSLRLSAPGQQLSAPPFWHDSAGIPSLRLPPPLAATDAAGGGSAGAEPAYRRQDAARGGGGGRKRTAAEVVRAVAISRKASRAGGAGDLPLAQQPQQPQQQQTQQVDTGGCEGSDAAAAVAAASAAGAAVCVDLAAGTFPELLASRQARLFSSHTAATTLHLPSGVGAGGMGWGPAAGPAAGTPCGRSCAAGGKRGPPQEEQQGHVGSELAVCFSTVPGVVYVLGSHQGGPPAVEAGTGTASSSGAEAVLPVVAIVAECVVPMSLALAGQT